MERKRQADQEAYYEDAPADVKQSGAESYAITRPAPPRAVLAASALSVGTVFLRRLCAGARGA
jgi:hypothetical protein